MKTISKYFRIIILLVVAFQINSCTEETDITSDTPPETTGEAMFWIASDLGVGSITVSCNGVSRTFNSYYSSGSPACGATGAANFTLNPGTYSYTASGGNLTWNGSITVTSGGCSKLQFTGSGGGTSGGGGSGTTSGQAMFWTASDLGVGAISVTCNGSTKTFNSYYSSGAPACGATGAANFTLNPGTYNYTASGGTLNWSGTITVTSGGCSKLQLTGSGTGGGTGGGGTSTGQAMFWTASDLGVGVISVTCNGSTSTFNSYYSSGAPACGATGAANFTLNPGTYNYNASGGTKTWSGTITVTSGGCSKLQLTNSSGGTGGGGGGVGTPGTSQVLVNQCVSGSVGDKKIFTISVPANVKTMVIETSEVVSVCDWNTADMFVRRGSNPIVTKTPSYTWTADCASTNNNRERESCTFSNPASGQWYVMLFGYNTYFISNLKVTVTY